jgi:hypothetical protein
VTERTQNVVRFESRALKNGEAHQPQQLLEHRHLPFKIIRRPRTGPFIGLAKIRSERFSANVKSNRDIFGLQLGDEFAENINKTVYAIYILATTVAQ